VVVQIALKSERIMAEMVVITSEKLSNIDSSRAWSERKRGAVSGGGRGTETAASMKWYVIRCGGCVALEALYSSSCGCLKSCFTTASVKVITK